MILDVQHSPTTMFIKCMSPNKLVQEQSWLWQVTADCRDDSSALLVCDCARSVMG